MKTHMLIVTHKGWKKSWSTGVYDNLPIGAYVPIRRFESFYNAYIIDVDGLPEYYVPEQSVIVDNNTMESKVEVFRAACKLAKVRVSRGLQKKASDGTLTQDSMNQMNQMWKKFIRDKVITIL